MPSCTTRRARRKRTSRHRCILFPEYHRSVSYESSLLSSLLAHNPSSSFLHTYLLCSSSMQLDRSSQEHRQAGHCSRSTGPCSIHLFGRLSHSRLHLVVGTPLGLTFRIIWTCWLILIQLPEESVSVCVCVCLRDQTDTAHHTGNCDELEL